MRVLLARSPSAHVLACTPSNIAADAIASLLLNLDLGPQSLLRLNAFSRPVDEIAFKSEMHQSQKECKTYWWVKGLSADQKFSGLKFRYQNMYGKTKVQASSFDTLSEKVVQQLSWFAVNLSHRY